METNVVYFGQGISLPCCPSEESIEGYYLLSSTTSPLTLSTSQIDNLISQGGTQTNFTFNLPSNPYNGQITTLTFNNAVTNLTINGNGKTINGTVPSSAAIGTRISFKYYRSIDVWIVF